MKQFDLLIGYYHLRLHPFYLNVIKYLAKEYRIGLLLSDEQDFYASRPAMARAKATDKLFRKLCFDLGAQPVLVNEKIHTRLFLMPVDGCYTDDYLNKVRANITYDHLYGLFWLIGKTRGLDIFKVMKPEKYYVHAKHLFICRAKAEGWLQDLEELELIELGMPYLKYPVFPELSGYLDYILAFPSPTHYSQGSLKWTKEKVAFIKDVYKLLSKIPNDKIVLKHHTLRDKERYFACFKFHNKFLLEKAAWLAEAIADIAPFGKSKFYSFAANCFYTIIFNKCPSLESLTPYHNFPVEVFMPMVKKGIITGYSGSALGALGVGLPVYNCDSRPRKEIAREYYESFQVDPCGGELNFDPKNFERIPLECRTSDFIAELKCAIEEACKSRVR